MGERISVIGKKGMDIKMKKMLVVYYSWSNGNTKKIAEQLADETGADIARIETTEPYRGSHEDVVEQGKREVEAGFMPQINPLSVIRQIKRCLFRQIKTGLSERYTMV